jgi:transposase
MGKLNDKQWEMIQHLFECAPRRSGGRPCADPRAVLDAIRWVEQTGERWLYLPAGFPPQQTCYAKYLLWKKSGLLAQIDAILGRPNRDPAAQVRSPSWCMA